jgi:stage III sporulation protein AA
MDEYYDAISRLPPWLERPLRCVAPEEACAIHEIRLRKGCPVIFTVRGVQTPASACSKALQSITIGAEQMEDILFSLCGGSVHAFEDELSCGYFTLPGGHRIGVGGRYIRDAQGHAVLQSVDSMNIRVARFLVCPLPPFLESLLQGRFTGLLLVGEPDSGKTTLLRSILPVLQAARRPAAVIDERGELFPDTPSGLSGFSWCDRIAGLDKATAIEMALRALGPQVILLDELGTMQETRLLEQGFFSGVDFVATLHAASLEEAEKKPQVQFMLSHGMLHHMCLLAGRRTPGVVKAGKDYC